MSKRPASPTRRTPGQPVAGAFEERARRPRTRSCHATPMARPVCADGIGRPPRPGAAPGRLLAAIQRSGAGGHRAKRGEPAKQIDRTVELRYRAAARLAGRPFTSGANRDRTGDLLLAKQALSQLSYGPARTAAPSGLRRCVAGAERHGSFPARECSGVRAPDTRPCRVKSGCKQPLATRRSRLEGTRMGDYARAAPRRAGRRGFGVPLATRRGGYSRGHCRTR